MNRRRFLKQAGLWVPAALAFPAIVRAQRSPFADPAKTGSLMRRAAPGCAIAASQTNRNDQFYVGQASTNVWTGQYNYTPGSNVNVCQIDWALEKQAGDISGLTYFAEIWTLNVKALDTMLGKSAGVTGSNAWNYTFVPFTFASPVALSSGVGYALTVTTEASDASNYAFLGLYTPAGGISGTAMAWKSDKNFNNDLATYVCECKVYYS